MKLRTSFCNGTVLKKDITRFAPVWGIYTVFLFLVITRFGSRYPANNAADVLDFAMLMLWGNLIYAFLCATMLLGDLFNTRMCNALHALPLRRDNWLTTHAIAGLLFSLVPNLLATLVMALLCGPYFYIALIWLAAVTLQYLFFFGSAMFSAMCAGNRLGMLAVYGILHFFSMLVYLLYNQFYEPLLYGIRLDIAGFMFFSPVVHLTREDLVVFTRLPSTPSGETLGVWGGFCPESWYYLFAIALIGMGLAALAYALYRRRKLEAAGDFIAICALRPVILVIYTLGVGAVMYGFCALFGVSSSYIFLLVGLIVGYFTGHMLLERRVSVFRKKTFLGFGAFALAILLSLGLTRLDPFNITRFVPEAEKVVSVRVYNSSDYYLFEQTDRPCYEFTDPEQIAFWSGIHRDLLTANNNDHHENTEVRIQYRLESGRTVTRYYPIWESNPHFETFRTYFSSYAYLFPEYDTELADHIYMAEVSLHDMGMAEWEYKTLVITDREELRALMQAVKADADAGNLAQSFIFHRYENQNGWIMLSTDNQAITHYNYDITFYPSSQHLTAFIREYLAEQQQTQ